jgi:hypothetical protein
MIFNIFVKLARFYEVSLIKPSISRFTEPIDCWFWSHPIPANGSLALRNAVADGVEDLEE